MNCIMTDWTWDDTPLKDSKFCLMLVADIKQLLTNRGASGLKNKKKLELVEHLKQNYTVTLNNVSYTDLTKKGLLSELKIRNLFNKDTKSKKKQEIIQILSTATKPIKSKDDDNREILRIIPWSHTEWKQPLNETFQLDEIQQLLLNRGAKIDELKMDKTELIKHLKNKYLVNLNIPFECLTIKAIKLEIRLLGYRATYRYYDKSQWIQRLKQVTQHHINIRLYTNLKHNKIPCSDSLKPIKLNNNEFFIATKKDGLYKYNVTDDEWIEWIKYPQDFISYDYGSVCMDKVNNLIYIYNDALISSLFQINYKTNEHKLYIQNPETRVRYPTLLFIHGQVHLFGNIRFGAQSHFIFDDKQGKFNKIHDFTEQGTIFYLSAQKRVVHSGVDERKSNVEIYDVVNGKWLHDSNALFGAAISRFHCLTKDERYLLYRKNDKISVMDLKTNKDFDTNIDIPANTSYSTMSCNSIVMNEGVKQNLIVFGFVRYCWNKYKIGFDIFPPQYLIKLMEKWCVDEYLHIIECGSGWYWSDNYNPRYQTHLKLRVDDILENAFELTS